MDASTAFGTCAVSDMHSLPHRPSPPFLFTGVSGPALNYVIEFLKHRAENPFTRPKRPIRDKSDLTKNGLEEWYSKFIEAIDMKIVFELLRAADFLRIEDLMDLSAARIARQYLQWTQHEKKSIFGVGKDLTPEEEAKLREEHKLVPEICDL